MRTVTVLSSSIAGKISNNDYHIYRFFINSMFSLKLKIIFTSVNSSENSHNCYAKPLYCQGWLQCAL